MNVYVGGWSLKPERDNQVSTPVAGSLHDGVLDLSFEPSGQRVKPITVTPGSLEPMSLASLGQGRAAGNWFLWAFLSHLSPICWSVHNSPSGSTRRLQFPTSPAPRPRRRRSVKWPGPKAV
jgi:hypothetical protein